MGLTALLPKDNKDCLIFKEKHQIMVFFLKKCTPYNYIY